MITSKDVNVEMKKAEEIVHNDELTVNDKIKALFKVLTVIVKITLGNRTNTVRLMEERKIPKLEPKRDEKATEEKKD